MSIKIQQVEVIGNNTKYSVNYNNQQNRTFIVPKDYILPVFYDKNITIKNMGDTAETKLLSAVEKSKN